MLGESSLFSYQLSAYSAILISARMRIQSNAINISVRNPLFNGESERRAIFLQSDSFEICNMILIHLKSACSFIFCEKYRC